MMPDDLQSRVRAKRLAEENIHSQLGQALAAHKKECPRGKEQRERERAKLRAELAAAEKAAKPKAEAQEKQSYAEMRKTYWDE